MNFIVLRLQTQRYRAFAFCKWLFCCVAGIVVLDATHSQDLLPIGLLKKSVDASSGYYLIAPLSSQTVFLLDTSGHIVHRWVTGHRPGMAVHLLDDGQLLMSAKAQNSFGFPKNSGSGGLLLRFAWNGDEVWRYEFASENRINHHDIEPLPNGNLLCLVWQQSSRIDAIRAGCPADVVPSNGIWFESIVELRPVGRASAEIVWHWNVKDHLAKKSGSERRVSIDLGQTLNADWLHLNSLDYNSSSDQILVTSRALSDFWILDHSLTTEQAAGPLGDILYRWRCAANQRNDHLPRIDSPHDAHWVAGSSQQILVFNNGSRLQPHSSVEELRLVDSTTLALRSEAMKAASTVWNWSPPGFYSPRLSSSQRLKNGHTLVCAGALHTVYEVRQDGEVAWKYRVPPRFAPKRNGFLKRKEDSVFFTAKLPEAKQRRWQEQTEIPLKDGGTLFHAHYYPIHYSAFAGRIRRKTEQ